ncbi:MAG: hypothetical protein JSW27_02475 [Phycisphaerales bacterium]|nr:MAG: hypothetical protein JSW27_02475 [Phycisphaerales bacterium]
MHRRSKKILMGAGVVVGLLIVIYGVALARSSTKLRAAYTALEEDGRPMVAAELIPPEVPEAENAAPYYLYAADVLKQQAVTRKKTLLEHLGALAFTFMGDTFEPEERAELEALMAQENVISVLTALEQALQRPACRFDCDYDNGLLTEAFPSRDLRLLARLWGVRACLEAEAGRAAHAWDMVQTQFRCADVLRYTPTVGGHLSRLGIISDLCHVVRKLYEIAPPSDEVCWKVEALLADHVDIEPLIYALDAERLLRGEWLFNLPHDRLYEALRRDGMILSHSGGPEAFSRLAFRAIAFRPRLLADHAAYLQAMRSAVHVLQSPYALREGAINQAYEDLSDRSLLTQELTPNIVFVKKIHCNMVAKVRLTRAGLRLLQYEKTHGTFPESLDALGLADLADPFVDKPLHYRTDGDGFLVYSVGEDQQDNGGTPRQPLDTSGRRPKVPEYDLLWRFPRETSQSPSSGT